MFHEFIAARRIHERMYRRRPSVRSPGGGNIHGCDPHCALSESPTHWKTLREVIEVAQISGPMIHDAKIAALCIHEFASFGPRPPRFQPWFPAQGRTRSANPGRRAAATRLAASRTAGDLAGVELLQHDLVKLAIAACRSVYLHPSHPLAAGEMKFFRYGCIRRFLPLYSPARSARPVRRQCWMVAARSSRSPSPAQRFVHEGVDAGQTARRRCRDGLFLARSIDFSADEGGLRIRTRNSLARLTSSACQHPDHLLPSFLRLCAFGVEQSR